MDVLKIQMAMDALRPLIENGYIEKVNEYSNWLTPIRLVQKPNGKFRFCLDLRGLNELVKQDNYPIPTISNITDSIRDRKIFSKIDI